MSATVVIAWRDLGCEHRSRAQDFVVEFWQRHLPDLELVVHPGPEPFSRSGALNAAIRDASYDLFFEVGPDSIVTPWSVRQALALAAAEPGLVVAHDSWYHLTPWATEQLLREGLDADLARYGVPEYAQDWGTTSVDVACFSRETWERAGGYDERFGVWGGDDAAFSIACDRLVAPTRRVRGRWLHLWHPRLPQSIPGNDGYAEQWELLSEYLRAGEEGPDAVRELVENRGQKEEPCSS